ncbi:MAG TPA: hypothetical protein VIH54_17155, partial [Chthoniobacterales bacterium]
YQGAYSMSWSLGILLGPALGGWILQTAGGHVLWSGRGIVGCLVAIAFWLFFDRIGIEEEERNGELQSRI